MGLCVVGPVGLVGTWVWWARGSGVPAGLVGLFCGVLTDKSPT